MDKTEMEKLMDRYKREMLEFRRANPSGTDTDAETGNVRERDRSDPLPLREDEQPQAVPAQTQPAVPVRNPVFTAEDVTDVRRKLADSCEGVESGNASPEQKRKCGEINRFLNENKESGVLSVQAFASDRVFGIGSARVMIFLPLASGNVTLYDGITDISGLTDKVRLPAPSRELSQSPGGNKALPYAEYSVYVEHPDYVRSVFTNIPVFSGVESIQPVRMLAKVEGTSEPEPIVVNETAFGNL